MKGMNVEYDLRGSEGATLRSWRIFPIDTKHMKDVKINMPFYATNFPPDF